MQIFNDLFIAVNHRYIYISIILFFLVRIFPVVTINRGYRAWGKSICPSYMDMKWQVNSLKFFIVLAYMVNVSGLFNFNPQILVIHFKIPGINNYHLMTGLSHNLFINEFTELLQILLLVFFLSLFTYPLSFKGAFKKFMQERFYDFRFTESEKEENKNSKNREVSLIKFFLYLFKCIIEHLVLKILPTLVTLLIIMFSHQMFYYLLVIMDNVFYLHGMYFLDWISRTNLPFQSPKELYDKGYYFSIFFALNLSTWFFLILYNNPNTRKEQTFRYLVLAVILFFGLQIGSFSLINLFYYIRNSIAYEWFYVEINNHNMALRFTSFLIFLQLLSFVLKDIFKNKFIIDGLVPRIINTGTNHRGFGTLRNSDYSTIYLYQIGLYIFLTYILWHFVRLDIHNWEITVFTWALCGIFGKWSIIQLYTSKLNVIIKWHKLRLMFFEYGLMIISLFTLMITKSWGYFIIGVILYLILLNFRFSNYYKINVNKD